MDIGERFDKINENSNLSFKDITNKRSNRPDVHVIILLNSLFPYASERNLISRAHYDQIWFDIDEESLNKLTDDQIKELLACGVFYDTDGLSMLV